MTLPTRLVGTHKKSSNCQNVRYLWEDITFNYAFLWTKSHYHFPSKAWYWREKKKTAITKFYFLKEKKTAPLGGMEKGKKSSIHTRPIGTRKHETIWESRNHSFELTFPTSCYWSCPPFFKDAPPPALIGS